MTPGLVPGADAQRINVRASFRAGWAAGRDWAREHERDAILAERRDDVAPDLAPALGRTANAIRHKRSQARL